MAKYETDAPCRLIDPKDTGEEFIWPEYEQKDSSLPQEDAPISDFAREMRDRVRGTVFSACVLPTCL